MQKTGRSAADTRAFLAAQNPGGALVTMDEVSSCVMGFLGDGHNGAVVELLGNGRSREASQT
jgi:hypothetical protein